MCVFEFHITGLLLSCASGGGQGATLSLSHVLYIGVSHSQYYALLDVQLLPNQSRMAQRNVGQSSTLATRRKVTCYKSRNLAKFQLRVLIMKNYLVNCAIFLHGPLRLPNIFLAGSPFKTTDIDCDK